jgi:hypothetical protein
MEEMAALEATAGVVAEPLEMGEPEAMVGTAETADLVLRVVLPERVERAVQQEEVARPMAPTVFPASRAIVLHQELLIL